jgi:bifunctional DNA-binding transcriptional regulator/antitoxin component of YhaV-PrlF toxin-antitoxin module
MEMEALMTTLTVTAKGQITLKQELLRHLKVSPGQKVEVDCRTIPGRPNWPPEPFAAPN